MSRMEQAVECIKKYNPEKIILFGSHARCEADGASDLDFVVIKKTNKRFIERLIEVAKLMDNALGKVDVFVYTPQEFEDMGLRGNPFIERVLKDGKTIYETK